MIAKFQKPHRGMARALILSAGVGMLTLMDPAHGQAPASTPADNSSPPIIVKTIPAIGATNVDPNLKRIEVVFDQDMARGYSWTGGGPDYPPMPPGAKPKWLDKRTCILPVELNAGHYYRVGINSKSYHGFSSIHGVAALPAALFFTTEGASQELVAKTRIPQVVRMEPKNGARNVRTDLAEVRVTFNMRMGDGFSWCTAGDDDHDFPKGRPGQGPHWMADKMTCVLPVTLRPGMTYRISLNAPEFKNFQSEAGVPLEPVAYSFTTSGEATMLLAGSDWEQEQKESFDRGNKWAAYKLWDAYAHGRHNIAASPEKADKWLREFVQDVWVVRFEPVESFAPANPQEFLARLSQYAHTYSGQNDVGLGSFFRTTKQGDKLVGSFLVKDPDEFKSRLEQVPGVKLVSSEKITPEKFVEYEALPQESL